MIIPVEWILLALQIVLGGAFLLAVAYAVEWWINYMDRRDTARRQRSRYTTADSQQIDKDVDAMAKAIAKGITDAERMRIRTTPTTVVAVELERTP